MVKWSINWLAVGFLLTIPQIAFCADSEKGDKATGFLDFNYYYDTRDFDVLTINALANITERVQYFSLTNYSNSISTNKNFIRNRLFSEQNIRWLAIQEKFPTDLTLQWVISNPGKKDLLRLGFRFRVSSFNWLKSAFQSLNMSYTTNFHLLQIDHVDGFDWQIEHVYKFVPNILEKRIYIGGFADHNFSPGKSVLVTEHQLGFRVVDQLFLVAEYRHNGFLKTKKSGVGLGIEYKIIF